MNVNVYLIVLILENNHIYAMIQNKDIPNVYLDGFNNSYSAAENIMQSSMNISGKWIEAQPKNIGVIDDAGRTDDAGSRLISIIYYLPLLSKNTLSESYRWVDLEDLECIDISEEAKNVIRYAALYI